LKENDIDAIGFAAGNIFYSEAHWMMAVYYMRIAHNVPKIKEGLHDQVKDYSLMLRVGIVLSVFFPILEGTIWCVEDYSWQENNANYSILSASLLAGSEFGTYMQFLTYGLLISKSIMTIRRESI